MKDKENLIESLRKANERLQNELEEQVQNADRIETQKHILDCKYNNII